MLMGLLTQVGISLAGEDVWTRKADMPTARAELSTSVVDGKIYAIGGWRPPDEQLSIVEEYDPETDIGQRRPICQLREADWLPVQ
jgi:hypothetical protein